MKKKVLKQNSRISSLKFQKIVYDYYKINKRDLPWRVYSEKFDTLTSFYRVLVSELMLQQTQVDRVIPKYIEFLRLFPTLQKLAQASSRDVLLAWQGLGYNRRALLLQKCAQEIFSAFDGKIPDDLTVLPGIGKYTAGAVNAFAFNKPEIVIETNIRTVYIFHFLQGKKEVHDDDLIPLIEKTMDKKNPRDWFNALMDYGTYLKKEHGNLSRKSSLYTKQTKFEGSSRQLRARVLRSSLKKSCTFAQLTEDFTDIRLQKVIDELVKEKFIVLYGKKYCVK